MKLMKEIVIPAVPAVPKHTVLRYDKTLCDICGKNLENDKDHRFDIARTNVSMEIGDNFPDGGVFERTHVDMCTGCFSNKLIPWLQAQGAQLTIEDHYI